MAARAASSCILVVVGVACVQPATRIAVPASNTVAILALAMFMRVTFHVEKFGRRSLLVLLILLLLRFFLGLLELLQIGFRLLLARFFRGIGGVLHPFKFIQVSLQKLLYPQGHR